MALSRNGVLSVAPSLDLLFGTGQAYLWNLARAEDGTIYAGTGNQGRLYRIDLSGKGEILWTAPQPEIFAVAAGPGGVVFAGTSPNGKIYRIERGKAAEYFNPKATYIWSLAIGRDGALYAGTGADGKVFRVTSAGVGEEYFATGQANVTGLQFAKDGSLLAGNGAEWSTLPDYRERQKRLPFTIRTSPRFELWPKQRMGAFMPQG